MVSSATRLLSAEALTAGCVWTPRLGCEDRKKQGRQRRDMKVNCSSCRDHPGNSLPAQMALHSPHSLAVSSQHSHFTWHGTRHEFSHFLSTSSIVLQEGRLGQAAFPLCKILPPIFQLEVILLRFSLLYLYGFTATN